MPVNWHIFDVIYMHLHVAILPRPITVIWRDFYPDIYTILNRI